MSVAWDENSTAVPQPRLRGFLVAAVLLHLALFFWLTMAGGIFGGPGPGGGDSVTFQLAAGSMNDRYAAPRPRKAAAKPQPKPVVKKPEPPKPKPEQAVRKADKPLPKPERKPEPVPEPQEEPQASAGNGVEGGKGGGAGGDAKKTILNRKGNALTGGQIRSHMVGKTLKLEMGRIERQRSNKLINMTLELDADGSMDVDLTQYLATNYLKEYSSEKHKSGSGKWWIEDNRFCFSSPEIQYGAEDCFDMTLDGDLLRLYYAPCSARSSLICRSGDLAGQGRIVMTSR